MINYINELSVSDNLRESVHEAGDGFPFIANELSAVEYVNNCAIWHWHDFVEFAIVIAGTIECCTPQNTLRIQAGEGYFINANVLHLNRMAAESSNARYRVLQFDTDMLTGATGVGLKYIAPVEKCAAIHALRISTETPISSSMLNELANLFKIAATEPEQYELHLLRHIVGLWMNLFAMVKPALPEITVATDLASNRVKAMLAFIHDHYSEAIDVEDIAGAATISRREAFRCFRQVLDTTPTLYVLQHRINNGARMLMETEKTITEISMDCGFSSPSYFCKAFHDLTGVSPRDFRRQNRK